FKIKKRIQIKHCILMIRVRKLMLIYLTDIPDIGRALYWTTQKNFIDLTYFSITGRMLKYD
ncbi:MAG: hypothetical protein CMK92_04280, partial [Pseudomonas sp.]|nr:hypothetical protein [Pseudomonas sp.]